jgi:ATP-dependent protease ClpP protease subunit
MDNYNNGNNRDNNEPQQIFPFFPHKEQIRSFKRNIPVSVYDFYIIDEIKEPDRYLELIHTLKTADPHDTIFIYLNTVGGDLYTTIQILAAMNGSHAKIITCLEGQACSAGTFIFLKGDTKLVSPHSTFMIHNYSQATSGKGNEVVQHVNYMGDYYKQLASDIYGDFLTKEEIEVVVNGDDLWMGSHEVIRRLHENGHEYAYTGEDFEIENILEPPKPKTRKKRATKKRATRKPSEK